MSELKLQDWNWIALLAGQALVGNVSPNFRMVMLCLDGNEWRLDVVLREASEADEDAAEEAADRLSIQLDDIRDQISPDAYLDVSHKVSVSAEPGEWPAEDMHRRIIFRVRPDSW